MVYYTLEIFSQPIIEFAVSTTQKIENTKLNIIDHRENTFEIGTALGCDMSIESDGVPDIRKEGTLRVYFPDRKYVLKPLKSEEATHFMAESLAFRVDDMKLERVEINGEAETMEWMEGLSPGVIILSETPTESKEKDSSALRLIESMINCRLDISTSGKLKCLSLLYELLATLDFSIRQQIRTRFEKMRNIPSSSYYHVYRIKKYINSVLPEKLTVAAIAKAVGLSPDYVGKIFRNECGMSIPSYIAKCRVECIRSFIRSNPDTPLSETAAMAGFSDLRHAQRVFKQYTGITMFRCRQLNGGLTLWHRNPWEEQNLEGDIFVRDEENRDIRN